ncbi:hypothetical protein BH11BAC1_BH11BAC1_06040 [soil metagenome]
MSKKNISISTILLVLFFSVYLISCTKDKYEDRINYELFLMAKGTVGFKWYLNSDVIKPKSSGSGHSKPFLRTRYNSVASTQLDSTGQIIPGSIFPEGSLVVKELFDDATTLGRYAVLFKKTGDANADAKGWIWGYINADGTIAEPSSNKGKACSGCHSQSGNIDYMLMSKYFQ